MGASNSKLEEDKSLQLCRDRKKYVKKALDGRCMLADTHVTYIQSLRSIGRALREFSELEGPIESSFRTSTDVTLEPLVAGGKHASGFSFSSISDTRSPSLSPFHKRFQARNMKFEHGVSQKIEGKVYSHVTGRVTASNAPQKTIQHPVTKHGSVSAPSPLPVETSPWDYFNLSHSVDEQQSAHGRSGWNVRFNSGGAKSSSAEDERKGNEPDDSIVESEDDDERNFVNEREDSDKLYNDCDENLSERFVRSFGSNNKATGIMGAASSPSTASVSTEISDIMPRGIGRSPDLSPLGVIATSVSAPVYLTKLVEKDEADIEESLTGSTGSKGSPKDLRSSMRDIDQLFVKASESGQEVPRMLEANKLHFRPKLPKRKGELKISRCLNACFTCEEEPSQVPKDPVQANTRYLTWQKTMSARAFSSVDADGQNARDDALANSINDIYCMRSGSHASTLDRLYAWEKKLYDEVKVSQVVRNAYDMKCKLLRDQESRGEPAHRVDKTRVVIKDLHSRIRVAIKRMESISKKIEELRDNELQPQLEELVKGLGKMWETMHDCHKLQFHIISVALGCGTKIGINSDSHQQLTFHLERQLSLMSSSFAKWIAAHKSYLQAIDGWLLKCVLFPEKSSKKKRRHKPVSVRGYGPPIFTTCGKWLEGLEKLPTKDLADSIKCLAAETSRLLPRQDKHHSDETNVINTLYSFGDGCKGTTGSNVWRSDFDNFRSSLVQFFSQLNIFSESSVNIYRELDISIQEAKTYYKQLLKSL